MRRLPMTKPLRSFLSVTNYVSIVLVIVFQCLVGNAAVAHAYSSTASISGSASIDSGLQGSFTVCFYANGSFCTQTSDSGAYSIQIPTTYADGSSPVAYTVDLQGQSGKFSFWTNYLAFSLDPSITNADLNLTLQTQQVQSTYQDQFGTPIANAVENLNDIPGSSPYDNQCQQLDFVSSVLTLSVLCASHNPGRWHYADTQTSDTSGKATFTVLKHYLAKAVAVATGYTTGGSGTATVDNPQSVYMLANYPGLTVSTYGGDVNTIPAFSWSASANASTYDVFRIRAADCAPLPITSTTICNLAGLQPVAQLAGTTFTDQASLPDADYLYYLSAYDQFEHVTALQGPLGFNLDRTAPAISGTPTWSVNPLPLNSTTTLVVPATDTTIPGGGGGIGGGEYFIGSDPGVGNGMTMGNALNGVVGDYAVADVGSGLGVGVYTIGVRVRDYSFNWSPVTYTMLVVYDPTTTLGMSGKNKKDLVPSIANGDIMPGLISTTQADAADYGMAIDYKNGVIDPHSAFQFNYATGTDCKKPTGTNCHTFSLNATNFDWLIIDSTNSSRGRVQGLASVTIDGTTTTNPFTVTGIDGTRLTPADNSSLILQVFATGADPSTSSPIYQASGSMASTSSVKIQ